MTVSLDSAAQARIIAPTRGIAWLVEMYFTTGTLRFTTWGVNVSSGGNLYTAIGNLVEVASINESEDMSASKVSLKFSLVNTGLLAATLGNVDSYRGKEVKLYLQLFDDTHQPDGAAILRWKGYMDRVSVNRTSGTADQGSHGTVEMQCSRAGMARARNYTGLRLTDAQQKSRFPGDRGLEYVTALIERPSLWLSRAFQEQE